MPDKRDIICERRIPLLPEHPPRARLRQVPRIALRGAVILPPEEAVRADGETVVAVVTVAADENGDLLGVDVSPDAVSGDVERVPRHAVARRHHPVGRDEGAAAVTVAAAAAGVGGKTRLEKRINKGLDNGSNG